MLKIKTLYEVGAISLDDALELASSYRMKQTNALTCDQAFEQWLSRYAKPQTKTWRKQEYRWCKYISPTWGHTPITCITQSDIAGLIASMHDKQTLANRLIELFSSVWSRCEEWKLINISNPCKHIQKYKLKSRIRYAELEEVERLLSAINDIESWKIRNCIKLILFTGCRKTEIMSLKWSNVKMQSKVIILEDTKNGNDFVLPMTEHIYNILDSLPRSPKFVFPADSASGHIVSINKAFMQACEKANIDSLRIHDLRRTVASHLLQGGASMAQVGDLFNHKDPKSTKAYSVFNTSNRATLLDQYSAKILCKNIS